MPVMEGHIACLLGLVGINIESTVRGHFNNSDDIHGMLTCAIFSCDDYMYADDAVENKYI